MSNDSKLIKIRRVYTQDVINRFLLIDFACLIPPAHAVDYVKC